MINPFAKVKYVVQNYLGKESKEAQKPETTEPVITEKKD
jgi:hypothetical protein